MRYKGSSFWLFVTHVDLTVPTKLTGHEFENEWLRIEKNGEITVKGSHGNGYAWDGCSPKFAFLDLVWGTPDGVVDVKTEKPKTYYASMIHDVLYQFYNKHPFTRQEIDRQFLIMLDGFKLKYLYYLAVRLLGWLAIRRNTST